MRSAAPVLRFAVACRLSRAWRVLLATSYRTELGILCSARCSHSGGLLVLDSALAFCRQEKILMLEAARTEEVLFTEAGEDAFLSGVERDLVEDQRILDFLHFALPVGPTTGGRLDSVSIATVWRYWDRGQINISTPFVCPAMLPFPLLDIDTL